MIHDTNFCVLSHPDEDHNGDENEEDDATKDDSKNQKWER